MRLRLLTTFAVAVAATFAASACSSDSPAAPTPAVPGAAPSQSLLGGLLGGSTQTKTIIPLLRTMPLAADVTVSQTIGVLGGTIAIPSAGMTLVVPPLAVSKPTNFAITARRGSFLAYDMEPHGTKFLVPLVLTQNLTNTNARGILNLSLSLGYYPDPAHVTSVSELLSVEVDLLRLTAVSTIPHFSGFIFAGGVESDQ